MAASVGDVLKVTLFQNADTVLNVFFYEIVQNGTEPENYEQVGEEFWTQVGAAFRAWIPAAYTDWFDRVVVENITNEIDFGIFTITGTDRNGARVVSTDFNPLWLCAPVRLNVGTRLTRPGQKRISGLVEADVSNGTILPAPLALVQTLADTFTVMLTYDVLEAAEARPVIYGPVIPPSPSDPVGRPAPVTNPVTSATAISYMTSQRTRR